MAKGNVKLSIYSTFDDAGTKKAEKAVERFTRAFGTLGDDGRTKTISDTARGLLDMSIKADQTAATLNRMADKSDAAARALAPLSAAAGAVAVASIKMAADFETGVAKVMTIADRSKVSADEMGRSLLGLSTETGRSATELAEAAYQALSASVDTSKVVDFTEQAVKLSKAGFTETATAVDVLTTAINAYGMNADDAGSIADKLVQVQNAGKTTVDQLAQSMGNVIPTAAAYGVSLDQLATGYIVMTKQGINTTNATTALNGMMTELADEGSTVAGILREKTGKSFGELMADGASLGDVLGILQESVGGNSEQFANLWGNVRASKGALAIANQGADEFNRQLSGVAHAAGTVDEALEVLKTPASEANKALNALKNAGIELGQAFLAMLAPALESLKTGAQDLAKWLGGLDDHQKRMLATVIAITAASAPLMKAVSGILRTGAAGATMFAQIAASAAKLAQAEDLSTAAALRHAAAMRLSKVAAAGLAAALIGVIAYGIAELVNMSKRAAERQEKLAKTTDGVRDTAKHAAEALSRNGAAYYDLASGADDAASATDRVGESLLRYAENAKTSINDASASIGQLEAARDTIDALTQKYDENGNRAKLTADEQAKLAAAVQIVNDATDAGIEITDISTGTLTRNGEAIQGLVGDLDDLITKKQTELRLRALEEAYTDSLKAREEAQKALNDATKEYEDYARRAADAGGEMTEEGRVWTEKARQAKEEVDGLSQQLDAATDAVGYYETAMGNAAIEAQLLSTSVADFAAAHQDSFVPALEESGYSLEEFQQALTDAGIGVTELNSLNSDQLAQIAASYDGTTASIIGSVRGMVSENKTQLESAVPIFGDTAKQAAVSYAQGIIEKASGASTAAGDMASGAEAAATVDTTSLGEDFAEGYAEGIRSKYDVVAGAAELLANRAAEIVASAQVSSSPSKVTRRLGTYFGQGYALGIEDETPAAALAAQRMVDAAASVDTGSLRVPSVVAAAPASGGAGSREAVRLLRRIADGGAGGPSVTVYINGAVVNSEGAIDERLYGLLTELQRLGMMEEVIR